MAHQIDSIAIHSYHYAMGWTSPYGLRQLYWNKFGVPEKGISYVGDWQSPIFMWWVDPDKEKQLLAAQRDNNYLSPPNVGTPASNGDWIEVDYWNKKSALTD